MIRLSAGLAGAFARIAADNLGCEYPNKLDHMLESSSDLASPRQLHPVFYGSYDWHSSVHMHWLLMRLIAMFPEAGWVGDATELLTSQFDPTKIAGECAYIERPISRTFERTYGWAWLLALFGEATTLAVAYAPARAWVAALAPLAGRFRQRYLAFLPVADFAIRSGTHQNSAFGLLLSRTAALQTDDVELLATLDQKARQWFLGDRCYPAAYEPQGSDFLSAGLIEAALMEQVLADDFQAWWQDFKPHGQALGVWTAVVAVSDRSDAQMSHLDGLNLSRAWCLKRISRALKDDQRALFLDAATAQIDAAVSHASDGHFVSIHWLATFATLALSDSTTGL